MTTRTFDKDSVIFRQGDFSHDMYDIISGSVGIYTDYGRENENRITVLHAGDFLGEMGLIEIYPRSATAVAMEDGTTLQVIGEKEFSDYFKTRSDRLLAIMRQLSHRLRDLTEAFDFDSMECVLGMLEEYRMPESFAPHYEAIKTQIHNVDQGALMKELDSCLSSM